MDRSTVVAILIAVIVIGGVFAVIAAYVVRSLKPEASLGEFHAGGQIPVATEVVKLGDEMLATKDLFCFPRASSVVPFRMLLSSGRSNEAVQFALEREVVSIPKGGKFVVNSLDVETAGLRLKSRMLPCYVARADVVKD